MLNTPNFEKLFADCLNPKQKFIKTDVDILARACAINRTKRKNTLSFPSLVDSTRDEEITDDDLIQAQNIRNYYSKKLIYWNLSGNKISSFRSALAAVLTSDPKITEEQHIGIIYKLPSFYLYDIEVDIMFDNIFTDRMLKSHAGFQLKELVPVKKLIKKTKHANQLNYFFEIKDKKQAAVITLNTNYNDKSLVSIWDKLFDNEKNIHIKGIFNISKRTTENFSYYAVNNWEIIKNLTTGE